jgi:hypothetical protein
MELLLYNIGLHCLNSIFHREYSLLALCMSLSMEQTAMVSLGECIAISFKHQFCRCGERGCLMLEHHARSQLAKKHGLGSATCVCKYFGKH